jgi:hypothetical protein
MAGITGVVVVVVVVVVVDIVVVITTTTTTITTTTTTTNTTTTTTITTCEKSFNKARSNLVGTAFSAEEFVRICSVAVNKILRAENKMIRNA